MSDSVNRVLVSIGPINIYWYSFLIIMAVIIGYNIVTNYSNKLSYKTGAIMDMTFGLVIAAIIGARVYYCLFNFDAYSDNLLGMLMIWNGGLAIYGAVIGGLLYILYYCKKHDMEFLKVLDILSLSLLLGQAIGRWGNFFNSEAYGGKTTYEALKNVLIPDFIIEGMYIDGFYRQPTFLYESIWWGTDIYPWYNEKHFLTYLRQKLYIDPPEISEEEKEVIKETVEFQNMPYYPNQGSIRKINGVYVIKIGEN